MALRIAGAYERCLPKDKLRSDPWNHEQIPLQFEEALQTRHQNVDQQQP